MRRSRRVWLGLALLMLVVGCAANRGGGWRIGLDAYRDGRVDDAELIWLEALSQAEEYGDEDPRLAQSLRMLGNLYIHSGRFDEAAPMMERWLGVVERLGDVSGESFADGLEAIAGIHLPRMLF